LFHPYIWAYNFTENPNIYKACYELVEYAKRTEFIVSLYLENGIQAPDVMRYSEISSLEDFHSKLFDELTDPELFMQLSKSIEKYLRYDKSKKKIVREYLSYFRSQKFLDSKNAFQQIIGFLKHKKNIVPLKLLLKTTGNVAKFEMQEHEYKVFAEKIKYMAPDVIYSIDKVEKFDHGLYNTKDGSPSPFGKRVTMEEYDRIRRERFASESWDVLKDLVPAYFELRTVYYNKIDEPLIAKVYNSFKFEYARCDSLMELKERGEIGLKIIPASDFMNFVSFAKANKLKFYIDYMGDYAPCSLNEIPVIYNLYNEEKILSIIDHLMDATIYESHM